LDEFKKYFKAGIFNAAATNEQIEELYNLVSSLDGTEGITSDELEYVMSFNPDDNALSPKDIELFLEGVKKN